MTGDASSKTIMTDDYANCAMINNFKTYLSIQWQIMYGIQDLRLRSLAGLNFQINIDINKKVIIH